MNIHTGNTVLLAWRRNHGKRVLADRFAHGDVDPDEYRKRLQVPSGKRG